MIVFGMPMCYVYVCGVVSKQCFVFHRCFHNFCVVMNRGYPASVSLVMVSLVAWLRLFSCDSIVCVCLGVGCSAMVEGIKAEGSDRSKWSHWEYANLFFFLFISLFCFYSRTWKILNSPFVKLFFFVVYCKYKAFTRLNRSELFNW